MTIAYRQPFALSPSDYDNLSRKCHAPLLIAFLGCVTLLYLPLGAQAEISNNQFVEAKDGAGRPLVDDPGETYGTAWGDWNGDGYPDVWMGKHQYTPTAFYRNNGDGTFTNVTEGVVFDAAAHYGDDTHGVAWADFDNDGDDDLIEVCGGGAGEAAGSPTITDEWRNNLFVNSGGLLVEDAQGYGIDYPRGRSRTPLWVDFDNDGRLDLINGAFRSIEEQSPSAIFQQGDAGFVDVTLATGFSAGSCHSVMLSHLGPLGEASVICVDTSRVTGVYNTSVIPFADLQPVIGNALFNAYLSDLAIGDFNGDLLPDVFAGSTPPNPSTAVRTGPANDRIHAFIAAAAVERGFSFTAPGDVELEFGWETARPDIFLGAGGVAPPTNSDVGLRGPNLFPHRVRLTLSADNTAYQGLVPNRTGGIYIGLVDGSWQIRTLNAGGEVNVIARASGISTPTAIGSLSLTQGNMTPPALFINQAGGLVARPTAAAFLDPVATIQTYARSVVAGDFDNDMDLDTYIGSSGKVANVPNVLFENLGDATFRFIPGAGGAAGSILGRTDTVSMVDYDQDGFIDLFVTQGRLPAPFAYTAEHQLFRNQGNSNHWVLINLEGVASNRDGVGAILYATTPDGKMQMREQNNGVHRYVQDFVQTHFGLGSNTTVDLEVVWPSGIIDRFHDLAANQVYDLVEGSSQGSDFVLATADLSVAETAGTALINVTLTPAPGPGEQIQVAYQTADGTALAGSDYSSATGALTFLPGETQHTVPVMFLDDSAQEAAETFTLTFSSPNAPPVVATVTVLDDDDNGEPLPECGTPDYNRSTETGVFLWNDCGTNRWHTRMTAGGSSVSYLGSLTSDPAVSNLTGSSIEAGDRLPAPDYRLNVSGTAQDGFDFDLPAGARGCFTLSSPANLAVLAGANRVPVGLAVSLPDLGLCTRTLEVADPSLAESVGQAVFTVTLTPPPGVGEQIRVDYETADGTAQAGSDYTATSGNLVFGPGDTTLDVTVAVTNDAVAESVETFFLKLNSDQTNDATATATIRDDDLDTTPACNAPSPAYNKATETAIFLWNDCDTNRWHLRATGGGQTVSYQGSLTASPALDNLTGFSIEGSDRLPPNFRFDVNGPAQDGIDFNIPNGGEACLSVPEPNNVRIVAGANRIDVTGPISLPGFTACTPP